MRRVLLILALAVASAPAAHADPPQTHEILINRPSGFWTSNRPAVGGAYRYRLLLLGCAVALGMGWIVIRTVKKNASRRDPG